MNLLANFWWLSNLQFAIWHLNKWVDICDIFKFFLDYMHFGAFQDEKERIERLGGSVVHWGTWRVNGQLAVSRAIGESVSRRNMLLGGRTWNMYISRKGIQDDPSGWFLYSVAINLGSSPGWWAATAASYCPSRSGELPKLIATEYRNQGDGSPCKLKETTCRLRVFCPGSLNLGQKSILHECSLVFIKHVTCITLNAETSYGVVAKETKKV